MDKIKEFLTKLQNEYMIAKAGHEAIKLIEKQEKTEILVNDKFYNEDGERIISWKNCWEIEPKTEWERFQKLFHEKRQKRGLNVTTDWDITSDYVSRIAKVEAEEKLIDFTIEYTKGRMNEKLRNDLFSNKHLPKIREKIINLTLKLQL